MRLESKQVVQVPFQAQIRASQRLVRVVRAAGFLVDRSFVEEALVLLKPRLQRALKRRLAAVASAATTPCQRPFSGCASGNG